MSELPELEETNLKEIKDCGIYGGWITKDSIIKVDYEEHVETAIAILKSFLEINEEKRGDFYTKKYSIYRVMYRLGFIRLASHCNGEYISLECSKYLKPSEFQQRIISRSSDKEELEIYYLR